MLAVWRAGTRIVRLEYEVSTRVVVLFSVYLLRRRRVVVILRPRVILYPRCRVVRFNDYLSCFSLRCLSLCRQQSRINRMRRASCPARRERDKHKRNDNKAEHTRQRPRRTHAPTARRGRRRQGRTHKSMAERGRTEQGASKTRETKMHNPRAMNATYRRRKKMTPPTCRPDAQQMKRRHQPTTQAIKHCHACRHYLGTRDLR